MVSLNIRLDAPTTINLTKFVGLSPSNINWGDGNSTTNTLQHTYSSKGSYKISGDFDLVTEIQDNFTVSNLLTFDIRELLSLSKIGNNFLNNCNKLKYFSLYYNNIENIGSGFLNGCTSLRTFILQKSFVPDLISWGNVGINHTVTLHSDKKISNDYRNNVSWCPGLITNIRYTLTNLNFLWQRITENKVIQVLKNNLDIPGYEVSLDMYPKLKQAINNGTILVEEDIKYTVDSATKRAYKKDNLLNKTNFIMQIKYYFIDYQYTENGVIEELSEYIVTRLLRAVGYNYYKKTTDVSVIANKKYFLKITEDGEDLYILVEEPKVQELSTYYEYNKDIITVEIFKNVLYYCPLNENLRNIKINKKYVIADPIKDILNTSVKLYDTKIQNFAEYEDPPYCRGWIKFGMVDNLNLTNAEYEGDIETGLNFEILVKGTCKNLIIYNDKINEELGRREYIKINTDSLPEGKLIRGDYVLINTEQGVKSAYLERYGERIDILKYLDRSSSWLKISKGENYFYATADDNTVYNIHINLIYNDKYEGV